MSTIKMKIWDVSGSRSREVEAPDDVGVDRLMVLLVEKMDLPLNAPDGQLMSYKLHHRETGRQLLDSESLADAKVRDGDELRLQPEMAQVYQRFIAQPQRIR